MMKKEKIPHLKETTEDFAKCMKLSLTPVIESLTDKYVQASQSVIKVCCTNDPYIIFLSFGCF